MVRRVLSLWCVAAALVTAGCDLNPRPEDPGAHGLTSGPNAGSSDKTGSGGSASTAPPPPLGTGASGTPSGGRGPAAADAGVAIPPGSTSDASADAGSDAGASAHDGALK
jgi:hypothetical protein